MQKKQVYSSTHSRDKADPRFGKTLGMPRDAWPQLLKIAEKICYFYGCLTTSKNSTLESTCLWDIAV